MSDFNIQFEEQDQVITLEFEQAGGGAVKSVNGKTGVVVLDAEDVGAYTKPSGGIPKTDLASAVQTSLGKADSAYQKPSGGIPASDIASGVVPAVDNTLAISGAAADAKKTGDEIATVKDGLFAAFVTDTASGSIASFSDGADGVPVKSLTVDIEPVQDLHGQDAPYPAGGGKNKLDTSTVTVDNITFTPDANGYVTPSSTSSDTRGWGYANSQYKFSLPSGTYKFVWEIKTAGTSSNRGYRVYSESGTILADGYGNTLNTSGASTAFTISETTNIGVFIKQYDMVGRFMVISSTESTAWSPYENICPISGHTSVVVTRTGKNLLAKPFVYFSNASATLDDCFFVKAGQYTFHFDTSTATSWRFGIRLMDKDGNFLSDSGHNPVSGFFYNGSVKIWLNGADVTIKEIPINIVEDCYIRIVFANGNTSASTTVTGAQLEVGSTATAYEPYNGQTYTIDLDGTRYGGTLDVGTGVLTVDRMYKELSSNIPWQKSSSYPGGFYSANMNFTEDGHEIKVHTPFMCSHAKSVSAISEYVSGTCFMDNSVNIRIMSAGTTVAQWGEYLDAQKTAGTPVSCCFYVRNPYTIQLTSQEVKTLLGQNNIWSDIGDTEVEYRADTKLYIQKVMSS